MKATAAVLMVSAFLAVGCQEQSIVARGPRFGECARASYMVFPFGDANDAQDRRLYPNAASTVRGAFETALLEKGFKIVACPEARTSESIASVTSTVQADLTKEKPDPTLEKQHLAGEAKLRVGEQGITEEHAIEVGKRAGAEVVLVGTVTAFYRGIYLSNEKNYTTVGFTVKAIHVQSGEIVWQATRMQKTGWNYNYDPGMFAQEIARNLVKQLVGRES